MSSPGREKIFISYARLDSAELAQLLQKTLTASGFETWLDTERITGGASWTSAIEAALDEAPTVLALLSPGSFASEICRAEQLRALRMGKCVIPILARTPTDIPLHLEAKNYRDFSRSELFSQQFDILLADIRTGQGVVLEERFRQTYVTAGPVPENFVPRPRAVAALRDALTRERSSENLPLTALVGMGGIGKTRLAEALCRDAIIQQAFPDGVIWVAAGKEAASDRITQLREVGKALNDDLSRYDTELGCRNQFRTTIRHKAALIVVDDVWSARDVEVFRAESKGSALLFTTRDASIVAALGAYEHAASSLTSDEARAMLARWAAILPAQLPPEAAALIRECDSLPLALAMVGASLRGKPAILWKRRLERLRAAEIEHIEAQFPDYPYPNLFSAIKVSVDELDETARQRYLALAVVLDSMPVQPVMQQMLWQTTELDAAETAERFIELSLAQRQADGIVLHGLQHDYVRSLYPDRAALTLIHEALRLSRSVLLADPTQFASQLCGRLLAHSINPSVRAFTEAFTQTQARPWLRPISTSLTPPGGPLRFVVNSTGASHLAPCDARTRLIVSVVSTTGDLSVRSLETGEVLRTLTGHNADIVALAISTDEEHVISAAADNTIRAWDLREDQAFTSIECASTALCSGPMPGQFISGSADGAVRVHALNTGEVVRTFDGCDARINKLKLAHGRYLIAMAAAKLFVWDLQSNSTARSLSTPDDPNETRAPVVGSLTEIPGTSRVAFTQERTLSIWDLRNGELVSSAAHPEALFDQIACLSDGRSLLCACFLKGVRILDLVTGDWQQKFPNTGARVAYLSITSDSRSVVTVDNFAVIRVWDLQGETPADPQPGHSRWVRAIAMTDGGRYATSISMDGALLWELSSGKLAFGFDADWSLDAFRETHLTHIPGVWNQLEALLPERRLLTSLGTRLQIKRFNSDEVLSPAFGDHAALIVVVRATPDGRLAVSGAGDGLAKIWDVEGRKELATLAGHSAAITELAIDPARRRVVTASLDHAIKVWNLDTGYLLHTLHGHEREVIAVAIVPGTHHAISASFDQTLRVWDLDTGASVATFTADGALMSCAAAPDGVSIVAGEVAGHVHILRLEGVAKAPREAWETWSAEPNRPELGEELISLAGHYESSAELDNAEHFYELAVTVRVFLLGLRHSLIGQSLHALAGFYSRQQQLEKAEALLGAAIEMFEETQGPNSASVAVDLLNMAQLYATTSRWLEAEPLYRRAIAILESHSDVPGAVLAATFEGIAEALQVSGRETEAATYLARARAIQQHA